VERASPGHRRWTAARAAPRALRRCVSGSLSPSCEAP
jgi:hypothetical protein